MIKKLAFVAVLFAGFAVAGSPAQAASHKDRRLDVVSTGVGAGSTAGYFALNDWHWKWDSAPHGITSIGAMVLTTVGCAALSPIVATAVLDRPLTQREAGVLVGSCVIPFIGGWLVEQAYDAHPEWDPQYRAAPVRHVRYRRAHVRHVRVRHHRKRY